MGDGTANITLLHLAQVTQQRPASRCLVYHHREGSDPRLRWVVYARYADHCLRKRGVPVYKARWVAFWLYTSMVTGA